jgi:deazaflavin-dependent oxidoreductase (nitroreductase family)
MSESPDDFNAKVIDEFRANGGVVGGMFEGMPIALVHHKGAKTGTSRVNPLAYRRSGDSYVVFASKGGAPSNPDWYYNLMAHPETSIEVGTETIAVLASEATGEERERLFNEQAADHPQFAEYAKTAGRVIPVIVLTPTGA